LTIHVRQAEIENEGRAALGMRVEMPARCYAAPDARQDLMQEISMQVWKSLDQFAGLSHIDTWAYRIAIKTALAWQRITS